MRMWLTSCTRPGMRSNLSSSPGRSPCLIQVCVLHSASCDCSSAACRDACASSVVVSFSFGQTTDCGNGYMQLGVARIEGSRTARSRMECSAAAARQAAGNFGDRCGPQAAASCSRNRIGAWLLPATPPAVADAFDGPAVVGLDLHAWTTACSIVSLKAEEQRCKGAPTAMILCRSQV